MALNISSLQEYIQLHPELLVKYLYEDLTIRRARGYDISDITPGKFEARIFEPVAHLGPCCRIPQGTSNVIARMSEAACILDGQEYCETDLSQILRDAAFLFTAGGEKAGAIEQVIIDGQIASFVEALDVLTFQGDKSLPDDNLNRIDGLLKIAQNDGAVQVSLINGTAFQAINNVIKALPDVARKMKGGIVVFCSEKFAEAYSEVAIAMNLYNINPGVVPYGQERQAIGKEGITIMPTRGLNGTNKILVTPSQNVVWFSSKEDDHNTLSWQYSEYNQLYYWRIKTIFGVNLAIPEWAVLAEYDPAILENGITVNVNVVSPLGQNGGVLTDTTPIKVTGVTVSPNAANLIVGNTMTLTANVQPVNAGNKAVTWSSSDAAVATVDANGLVTAVAAGTATITVTTAEGNFTDTATITVAASRMMPLAADVGEVVGAKDSSKKGKKSSEPTISGDIKIDY